MAKRAINYCRVSTEQQGSKGYSLDEQDFLCTEHAVNKGYIVVDRVNEEISGTTYNRPGMDYIIELAQAKKIDVIICLELDRLARGILPLMIMDQQFKESGVKVEYVLNNFEEGADGDMMKTVMAAFAERERLRMRERLIRGKDGKARKNKVVQAGSAAYGYIFREDQYIIDETEANVVRMIFDWYINHGLGIVAITNKLTGLNIPTRRDSQGTARKIRKGAWNTSSVALILKNESYTGRLAWGKTRVDVITKKQVKMPEKDWIYVDVPVIVPVEVFEQARQQAKRNTTNNKRNSKNQYLLAGMIYCKTCGLTFGGISYAKAKNNWKGKLIYRCGNQVNHNHPYEGYRAPCPRKHLDVIMLDDFVWNIVVEMLQNPDRIAETLLSKRDNHSVNIQKQRREIVTKEIAKLVSQENRLLNLYLDEHLDRSLLRSKSEELRTAKQAFEQELSNLQKEDTQLVISDDAIENLRNYCKTISKGLAYFDFDERREVLRALQIKVYVDRSKNPIEVTLDGLIPITSTSLSSYSMA